jgi:hypothetical protein
MIAATGRYDRRFVPFDTISLRTLPGPQRVRRFSPNPVLQNYKASFRITTG